MILRRTHPALPYLSPNNPPNGTYNATNMARFIRNYRTVARGFYDAVRIRSLRAVIWVCPNCDSVNRNKNMNDLSGENPNYCGICGGVYSYDEIRLGCIK